MKKFLLVLVSLLAVGGFGSWYWLSTEGHAVTFRTVQVEYGDLLATVNATGTIEPEEVIDIGAQVAGQILSFGPDPRGIERLPALATTTVGLGVWPQGQAPAVAAAALYFGGSSGFKTIDFGSPVHVGTKLAEIDPRLYQAQADTALAQVGVAQAGVDSAGAQVGVAQANLNQAKANQDQLVAKHVQAQRDWERVQRLRPTRAVADVDSDTAQATYEATKAAVTVGQATILQMQATVKDAEAKLAQARANLASAQAALKQAQLNLGYCTITSPVEGVIVDRRVNIGQTVVSSLNTPSLFLIAKDLKRLQIWASVNEADIGSIHSGQNVTFTVDAFPERVFKGVVAPDQPRLNASMNQNVVTYTVVINTDNSDGKLKPYMTTTALFEVAKHAHVLLVPNSALRWKPTSPQQVAPEDRQNFITALRKKSQNAEKGGASGTEKQDKQPQHQGTLWIEDSGYVKPVKVKTGVSDGIQTEILSGIEPNTLVVLGENRAAEGSATTNPFAPKMFNQKKGQ
jgi:HlyD family secretion protein